MRLRALNITGFFVDLVLLVLLCLPPVAGAATVPRQEHHIYQLDFLIFENIAEGELKLIETEQSDVQRAELIGRTLGLASWLAGERTQRYIATMQAQGDGTMRSLMYESQVIKRRFGRWKTTRKRFMFDQEKREVVLEKEKNGEFVRKKSFDIPEGSLPVDILTGFYNLRAGAYGPLRTGTRLEIPTVTSKGMSSIAVDVLTPAQQEKQGLSSDKGGLLLQVSLDPEVFETTDGGLFLWLDADGKPSRGLVGNVIGLGDVKGSLREEGS